MCYEAWGDARAEGQEVQEWNQWRAKEAKEGILIQGKGHMGRGGSHEVRDGMQLELGRVEIFPVEQGKKNLTSNGSRKSRRQRKA